MNSDCPSLQQLEALLGARVDDDWALATHVEQCEACRSRLADLVGGLEWLSDFAGDAASDPPPSPHLQSVLQSLHASVADSAGSGAVSLSALDPPQSEQSRASIAHYDILETVGRGGMGSVFKAQDVRLHRLVAIKVLSPSLARRDADRARFLREARAAAAIRHEHVVTIHDVGEIRGLPYIVMEFVCGVTLARVLQQGSLDEGEICRIGMQLASGIAAAHAQGVIHRDIKPANILIEDCTHRVVITDFGLARAVTAGEEQSITLIGHIAGTPQYMSPEQARGEQADERSDLFALGCVLYAMCTGFPPFDAATPLATIRKVCDERPTSLSRASPSITIGLAQIVDRLMEKNARRRYSSAKAVEEELTLLRGAPVGTLVRSGALAHAGRRRRRLVLACIVVGVAGIIATGTRWIHPGQEAVNKASPSLPFVVLAKDASSQKAFASLGEAIGAAPAGATIEVRSSNRFEFTQPIFVGRDLTLRAAPGFTPTLVRPDDDLLLSTDSNLVLEGIAFEATSPRVPVRGLMARGMFFMIDAEGETLAAANCRFATESHAGAEATALRVATTQSIFRNCEFHSQKNAAITIRGSASDLRTVRVQNCAFATWAGVQVTVGPRKKLGLVLQRNTFSCDDEAILLGPGIESEGVTIQATDNVLCSEDLLADWYRFAQPRWPALDWRGRHNFFEGKHFASTFDEKVDFDQWKQGANGRSGLFREAAVLLASEQSGGTQPRSPQDFRVLSVAPLDGQPFTTDELGQVGADLRWLGPGRPFESWKQTAEYEHWRESE